MSSKLVRYAAAGVAMFVCKSAVRGTHIVKCLARQRPLIFGMFLVAAVLCNGAVVAAANFVTEAKETYSVRLDPLYTTIFQWDETTVAALSPKERKITLFRLQGAHKGRISRDIQLASGFESSGGDVYPDIVHRHASGDIYWLSRGGNRVAVYSSTGKLSQAFVLESDNYSWFEVRADRSLIAYFNSNKTESLGYEVYDSAGKLRDRHNGWLKPGKKQNSIARMFFFEISPAIRLEALAGFPYVRSTAHPATPVEITCPEVAKLTEMFHTSLYGEGLPRPLGDGYDGEQPAVPFILAAARGTGNSAYLLANGGTVIKVDAGKSITTLCWASPPTPENFVPTSLVVAPQWIAILTREQSGQAVRLRAWNLAR